MRKRTRRTGSFTATSDDGEQHTLHIFTEFIQAGDSSDPNAEVTGASSIKTEDGLHVNRLGKGEYQVVSTGMMLRSDDPDAP